MFYTTSDSKLFLTLWPLNLRLFLKVASEAYQYSIHVKMFNSRSVGILVLVLLIIVKNRFWYTVLSAN